MLLIALACWLPLEPVRERFEAPLRIEELDASGLRLVPPRSSVRSPTQAEEGGGYLRVVRVLTKSPRLSLLMPDPRALRSFVLPGAAFRVLDPRGLSIEALGPLRTGRPAALQLRAPRGRPGDRLRFFVNGVEQQGVEALPDDRGLRAQVQLPAIGSQPLELRFMHEARRAGRLGIIQARATLVPGPAPRVQLARGIPASSAFARALKLQGFEIRSAAEAAAGSSKSAVSGKPRAVPELWLANLADPIPSALQADVDAGAGAILVARSATRCDASWTTVLPLLAVDTQRPEAGLTQKNKLEQSAQGQPESAQPEPAKQKRASGAQAKPPLTPSKGLRRTGATGAEETHRALSQQTTIEAKALALVLAIDVSGSMSGPLEAPAIDQARRAAKESAATLGKGDEFAVVSFGKESRVVLPLGPATRRRELAAVLAGLRADSSATRAYAALELSWAQLKRSDAAVRHVLLLTDGDFTDKEANYEALVQAMKREGIGLSAIGSLGGATGGFAVGKFRFLDSLLRGVGTRVVLARNAQEIPRLLLGEVREVLAAARPLAQGGAAGRRTQRTSREQKKPLEPQPRPASERPKSAPPDKQAHEGAPELRLQLIDRDPVLLDLVRPPWPPLSSALDLEALPGARVHWAFLGSGRLALATSLYGLGRFVIWAGDGGRSGAKAFVADKRFPALVAQLAAWAQAPTLPGDQAAGRWRNRVVELLEGDGLSEELLDEAAQRIAGSRLASLAELDSSAFLWTRLRPGDPRLRILIVAGALLALLVVEFLLARRRRRLPR